MQVKLSLLRSISLTFYHWAQAEGPQVKYICIKRLKNPPPTLSYPPPPRVFQNIRLSAIGQKNPQFISYH